MVRFLHQLYSLCNRDLLQMMLSGVPLLHTKTADFMCCC